MSNVLRISGSNRALATGFRKSEENSPVNKIWDLILPLYGSDMEISYGQMCQIFDMTNVFSGVQFDFVTVDDRDYTPAAQYAIRTQIRRVPVTKGAVINIPAKILWG